MGKQTTNGDQPSIVVWDNLEEWVRRQVQEFIQSLLEEEVTELLGREKSERRQAVDSLPVYRNGHGKGRRLTLGCGSITPSIAPGCGAWSNGLRAGYCPCLPGGPPR